jgi:hypothetical protein
MLFPNSVLNECIIAKARFEEDRISKRALACYHSLKPPNGCASRTPISSGLCGTTRRRSSSRISARRHALTLADSFTCFEAFSGTNGISPSASEAIMTFDFHWNAFARHPEMTLCLGSALVCTRRSLGEIPSVPERGPWRDLGHCQARCDEKPSDRPVA